MKKKNNKCFLLVESLVVTTFVLTVLVFLFVQFKNLYDRYEDSYDYNTVEGIYNLKTFRKFLNIEDMIDSSSKVVIYENGSCNLKAGMDVNLFDTCESLADSMRLNKLIYYKNASDDIEGAMEEQSYKEFASRINKEASSGKSRLIGQFKYEDTDYYTYATIVY